MPPDLGDDPEKMQRYFAAQRQNPIETIQMQKAQNVYESRIDSKLVPFVRRFLPDLYKRYGCLLIGNKFYYLPIQLPIEHTNALFSMVRIAKINRSFPAFMVALNIWISTVKQYTSHVQMDPSKIMDHQWLITQSHMALCIQLLTELKFPLITIRMKDISAKYTDLWKDPKQWPVILRESNDYWDSFNLYLSIIVQQSMPKMAVVQKVDTRSQAKIVMTSLPNTAQLVIYKKKLTVIPEQCPFSFLDSMDYIQMWCMNPLNSIGQPDKCGWGSVHVPKIIGWMMVRNATELDDAKRTQWAEALQDLGCPPLIPCIDAKVEEELNRQWQLWVEPATTNSTNTKSTATTKSAITDSTISPTTSATSDSISSTSTRDLWNVSHSICYWPHSTDKSLTKEKCSTSPTNMFIDVAKADDTRHDIITSSIPTMTAKMITTTKIVDGVDDGVDDDDDDVDPMYHIGQYTPLTNKSSSRTDADDALNWQLYFDREKTTHNDCKIDDDESLQSQDCAAVFGEKQSLTTSSLFSDDFVV